MIVSPLFAFSLGMGEMLIIGIIAVLLYGKRLPEVARNFGRGLSEFKKGMYEIQDEFHRSVEDSSMDRTEVETEPDREEPTAPRFEPPRSESREETNTTTADTSGG